MAILSFPLSITINQFSQSAWSWPLERVEDKCKYDDRRSIHTYTSYLMVLITSVLSVTICKTTTVKLCITFTFRFVQGRMSTFRFVQDRISTFRFGRGQLLTFIFGSGWILTFRLWWNIIAQKIWSIIAAQIALVSDDLTIIL